MKKQGQIDEDVNLTLRMQTVKAFVNIAPHVRERQPKAVGQNHKQLCIPTDRLRQMEVAMS
jgi:hypothetical protein